MRPRLLVACGACRRQFDAGDRLPGSRFHCSCGTLLTVPAPAPHDAAVVRCSACGAPRTESAGSCRYCGADFTLHEQDLCTLCPGCMARIGDRSRFCHNCGTPIHPLGAAGEPTEHPCPACGGERRLGSRRFGEDLSALECDRCGGLWLGSEVFRLLEERARDGAGSGVAATPETAMSSRSEARDGPLYRPCPLCERLMHRRNYGRKSGVIVDACGEHGVWFDQGELDRVLAWIRQGGLERTRELEAEERRLAESRKRFSPAAEAPWPPEPSSRSLLEELLEALVRPR